MVLLSDGFSLNGSQTSSLLAPPAAWRWGWRGQVNVNLVDNVLVLAEASLCLLDNIHVVVVVVIVIVVDVVADTCHHTEYGHDHSQKGHLQVMRFFL